VHSITIMSTCLSSELFFIQLEFGDLPANRMAGNQY
jgi:hypothetical protein